MFFNLVWCLAFRVYELQATFFWGGLFCFSFYEVQLNESILTNSILNNQLVSCNLDIVMRSHISSSYVCIKCYDERSYNCFKSLRRSLPLYYKKIDCAFSRLWLASLRQ